MSRRSISKRTTILTSNSSVQSHNDLNIDASLLREDNFDKRPKTDYTYSRSATYSNKYEDGAVTSPNLSRRRLYTTDQMIRDQLAASSLKQTNSSSANSHVKVYGKTRSSAAANQSTINILGGDLASTNNTVNSNIAAYDNNVMSTYDNNHSSSSTQNQTVTQHTLYTTRNTQSQLSAERTSSEILQQNNNNSEAIFSGDESDSVMSRSASRRKYTKRASSRSRSPRRSTRGASSAGSVSKRRSAKHNEDEVDSDSALAELDARHAGGGNVRKAASYPISSGLDTESEMVTERSSTIIDTVATGPLMTAKLMGCVLFVYGCTRILMHRIWYNFGHPVYATLQRYLLLDSWLLSRGCMSKLRALILGLFLLLLPLIFLSGSVCSLHALGFVNVVPCSRITGVYYVTKRSDVNAPGISVKIRTMLNDLFTWNEARQPPPPVHTSGVPAVPSVDWETIIDARVAALRSTLELKSNTEMSIQRQKNTELQTAVTALTRDVEDVRQQLSTLTSSITELAELKAKVAHHSELIEIKADQQLIVKLQNDIKNLQMKLGEVNLEQEEGGESGVLVYLVNEINNLKTVVEKQKQVVIPTVCPESNCVCESELGLRLRTLRDQLLTELNEKGGTTVYVTPDNSTGISEQFVKQLIQDELDIFSADKTGMPDFALQSMGAQIVSTRCSQTYYQDTGIMTYFGLPLYHLHKDPSIVIQPGVTPGECWCFHGQSGTLVIELAESVQFNSFSLEHISAKQSVTGEILSAPRDLEVYGLTSELDTAGRKIGEWRYENVGPRLQFFPVLDTTIPGYPVVELRILNNWGKKEFTCLYRFRVHGKLAPK